MKPNDTFDFRRFGKYFMSDLKTCSSNFTLSLLTISVFIYTAIHILHSVYSMMMGNGWDAPDLGFRAFNFVALMFVLIVSMPVKCYGKLTDKQYGSFWLTLPASRLEKFLSMVTMTLFVAPITGAALYLGLDAIVCAVDPTCGDCVVKGAFGMLESIKSAVDPGEMAASGGMYVGSAINQLASPWLYIDDIIGMMLPFLLGAILFKSAKTVKTILVMSGVSTVASIIAIPVMMKYGWDIDLYSGNLEETNRFFKNIALFDTISDTVFNLALLTCIYFRIKTLKH